MTTKAEAETIEKRVKKLLAKYAPLEQQRLEICAVRDASTKTEQKKFDLACAPFNAVANEKLAPVEKDMKPIRDEIERLLAGAVDARGMALLKTVDTRDARAEVKQQSCRAVDPKELLDLVPEAERTPAFWLCFDVLIGNTKKFLGEEKLNALAEPDYKTPKVALSLR